MNEDKPFAGRTDIEWRYGRNGLRYYGISQQKLRSIADGMWVAFSDGNGKITSISLNDIIADYIRMAGGTPWVED